MHANGSRWLLACVLGASLLLMTGADRNWASQGKEAKVIPLKLEKTKPNLIDGKLTKDDKVDAQGKPQKFYSFQGETGHVYRFELKSKEFDPLLRLEDTTGKIVKNEDLGNGNLSRLAFRPEKAATYHLAVSSFVRGGMGAFTLDVVVVESKAPKVIKLAVEKGQPTKVEGLLTNQDGADLQGKYAKAYEFQAEPGKLYQFTMTAKKFGPELRVEDAMGRILKYQDSVTQNAVTLVFRSEPGGVFRLITSTMRPGDTGDFHLNAVVAEPREPKAAPVQFEEVRQARYTATLSARTASTTRAAS